jgi:L-cysteine S-thiosulfotransferase
MGGSIRSRPRFSADRTLRWRGRVGLPQAVRGGVAATPQMLKRCHPLPARWCGPISPLQGEVTARSATGATLRAAAVVAAVAGASSWANADAALRPYTIIGDAIPASLTGVPGDPIRGKAIVTSRQTGLCLLCHSAPLPEEKFQGTIGPDLTGAGSRNTEGQLRLRIVDPRIFNPDTIMPAYYRRDGLARVAPAFRGKTVLTAEQIEDVVAFLMTLRDKRMR